MDKPGTGKGRSLVVYGASGHGKVVADAAMAAGWEVLGFADDDPAARKRCLLGLPVVAVGIDELISFLGSRPASVVVGIGDNEARKAVFERVASAQLEIGTVVHPSAVIAPSAALGPGTVVLANVAVNADTVVGLNVILNTCASVDHDSVIEDHVHISPGAHLGGTVRVGEGTHVGIGASVKNNAAIGRWSVIGAGAVVIDDIPDGVLAYGVPARVTGEKLRSRV